MLIEHWSRRKQRDSGKASLVEINFTHKWIIGGCWTVDKAAIGSPVSSKTLIHLLPKDNILMISSAICSGLQNWK